MSTELKLGIAFLATLCTVPYLLTVYLLIVKVEFQPYMFQAMLFNWIGAIVCVSVLNFLRKK